MLFAPGAGTLFLLAFGAYIGFEGTAIYSEEARDPERSIPRATFIAVGFLAVFYALAFWVLVYAYGVDGAMVAAQGDDFLSMTYAVADQYVGSSLLTVLQVLIVTSFLATIIASTTPAPATSSRWGERAYFPRRWQGRTPQGVAARRERAA